MANGFLAATPGARHGADDIEVDAGYVIAQKFTCPGSGTQEVTEIGVWAKDNSAELRLALFTDDAGNACPEAMVGNSESATLTTTTSITKLDHSYGTVPEITNLWLQ